MEDLSFLDGSGFLLHWRPATRGFLGFGRLLRFDVASGNLPGIHLYGGAGRYDLFVADDGNLVGVESWQDDLSQLPLVQKLRIVSGNFERFPEVKIFF